MAKWIQIDPNEFNEAKSERVHGVDLEVFLSPYDIPEAVRGRYDDKKGRFVIEFKYIGGEEPIQSRQCDEFVKLNVGSRSKRLHSIEIDVDRLKTKAVSLNVAITDKVSTALSHSTSGLSPSDNYEITEQVISKKRNDLFEDLEAVH